MRFSTGTITTCAAGGHFHLPILIGQNTYDLVFTIADLAGNPASDIEEVREAILQRLRSAIIEANASTPAQKRAAIENKTNFGI